MSVSIKDIAKAAGVSPSTVSRAIHDHPRISQETKTRIRQLARELGYTPSLPARSLVTRHTATIGMVITTASDPFLAGLVQGVEETAERNGYSVFLSSSYRNAERELEVVRSLHERRASGIIITGTQIDDDYLEMSDLFPLPIVLINCRTYPYSVYADKLSGARQAIEHLVHLGHALRVIGRCWGKKTFPWAIAWFSREREHWRAASRQRDKCWPCHSLLRRSSVSTT
jgi:LacI family transcriptional regulator/LacI family repressor for deo operon, udp, cdd, tsx, nupC, and nupG